MGEKEEDGGGMSVITRVFIGGLGQTVTSTDLERTFSSVGRVKGVEIVRTNGRYFAYMDFESDQKSLKKIFSMYNGCTWRGGKLKLEKAKEHYLTRLRREWMEDEARKVDDESRKVLSTNAKPDTDESEKSSKKSKRLREEKVQLRIYFPRLRKVKLLPYAGSGKHKYSFQHIDQPPLPIHFCDCEQHCLPSEFAPIRHVTSDTMNNVMGKYELDIMNSVMEKLFKTEAEMVINSVEDNSLLEMNNASQLIHADKEEAAQSSDSDNLVTNIALEGGDASSAMDKLKEQISSIEQVSNSGISTKTKPQKNLSSPATEPKFGKKSHRIPADSGKEKESRKKQKAHHINDLVHVPENQGTDTRAETKDDMAGPTSVTIIESPPIEAATDCVWVQKASWRDLVSGKSSSTFRLSDIFQGPSALKEKLPEPSKATRVKLNRLGRPKSDDVLKVSSTDSMPIAMQPRQADDPNGTAQNLKEIDVSLRSANVNRTVVPETACRNVRMGESWRDLVSGKSSRKFKLSDIFQGPAAVTEKFPEPSEAVKLELNGVERQKSDDATKVSLTEYVPSAMQPEQVDPNGTAQNSKEADVSPKGGNINGSIIPQTPSGNLRTGEVCTFMRSAESEKEWAKARAAVSASLRGRKRTDSSAAGNAKRKPRHR